MGNCRLRESTAMSQEPTDRQGSVTTASARRRRFRFSEVVVLLTFCGCGGATSDDDDVAPRGAGGGATGGTAAGAPTQAGGAQSTGGQTGAFPGTGGGFPLADREGLIVGVDECAAFERCGGDPVGQWTIRYACWDVPSQPGRRILAEPECGAAHSARAHAISGTYVVLDGTMELMGQQSIVTSIQAEDDCVAAVTGEPPSAEACAAMAASITNDERDAACTLRDGGGCDCTVESDTQALAHGGTYDVEGGFITDELGNVLQFCVAGSEMVLSIPTEHGPMILTFVRTS